MVETKTIEMYVKRKAGRCANGFERDGGTKYHAVFSKSEWARALCGTEPGLKGNGWIDAWGSAQVTCPRCLARLAKFQQEG